MIEAWIREIKENPNSKAVGMFLIHNGIVRETSKKGIPIKALKLSYDKKKLEVLVNEIMKREGIYSVKVWINEGLLNIGDDIMKVLIAGRFRTDVFPALEELVTRIKKEIVNEEEIF